MSPHRKARAPDRRPRTVRPPAARRPLLVATARSPPAARRLGPEGARGPQHKHRGSSEAPGVEEVG